MGEVFRNPEYARALELIARQGPDAFYSGDIARAILKTSARLGGVMTAADLADFKPEWVEPISTTYRDWTVYELPPNGQGLAALEMLNIFEKYPLSEWGLLDTRAFHVDGSAETGLRGLKALRRRSQVRCCTDGRHYFKTLWR